MPIDELNSTPFSEENFNAPEYISCFLKQIKAGDELRHLQKLRKLLNARHNVAAEAIKDIVFEHYKHFIETSKEISNLERQIYQLSSLLSEQKHLMENLMEMNGQERKSTSSVSIYSISSNSQNQLHSLMHKMDGVAAILNTLKENEKILLQNQLTLLDSTTMEPLHPILMVLLANNLLIGYPNVSGGKYPFQLVANHMLEQVAVVNFKSHGHSMAETSTKKDNVLQLLVFPEQMYVMCENARQKRDWLECVEQTKRHHEQEKSLIRQATIRARRHSAMSATESGKSGRRVWKAVEASKTKLDAEPINEEPNTEENLTCADTQWLNDLIDELQVIISDRHTEQAVEMLLEWKSCGCKDTTINAKFAALEQQVVKILSDEVRRPGSLHGGTRALSRPLTLLTSLGRGVYAVDLYLRRRGAFLRSCTSELVSEEPLSYVKQISSLFVNEILDVANDFSNQRQHYCLVLQWASSELSVLLSMIRRNVIEVAPTITVLSNTWRILMNNCDFLIPIGMDLSFEVNRLLSSSLTSALQVNFNNVIESICLRISEEKWKPYNLENESNLNRFLEEMSDLGLAIDWAARGEPRFSIQIAQSACQFSRMAFSLSRDFSLFNSAHLECLTDSFLQMLWCEYLLHLSTALQNDVLSTTVQFIVSQVIPLCDKTYQTTSVPDGRFANKILTEKFPNLTKYAKTASFDDEVATV